MTKESAKDTQDTQGEGYRFLSVQAIGEVEEQVRRGLENGLISDKRRELGLACRIDDQERPSWREIHLGQQGTGNSITVEIPTDKEKRGIAIEFPDRKGDDSSRLIREPDSLTIDFERVIYHPNGDLGTRRMTGGQKEQALARLERWADFLRDQNDKREGRLISRRRFCTGAGGVAAGAIAGWAWLRATGKVPALAAVTKALLGGDKEKVIVVEVPAKKEKVTVNDEITREKLEKLCKDPAKAWILGRMFPSIPVSGIPYPLDGQTRVFGTTWFHPDGRRPLDTDEGIALDWMDTSEKIQERFYYDEDGHLRSFPEMETVETRGKRFNAQPVAEVTGPSVLEAVIYNPGNPHEQKWAMPHDKLYLIVRQDDQISAVRFDELFDAYPATQGPWVKLEKIERGNKHHYRVHWNPFSELEEGDTLAKTGACISALPVAANEHLKVWVAAEEQSGLDTFNEYFKGWMHFQVNQFANGTQLPTHNLVELVKAAKDSEMKSFATNLLAESTIAGKDLASIPMAMYTNNLNQELQRLVLKGQEFTVTEQRERKTVSIELGEGVKLNSMGVELMAGEEVGQVFSKEFDLDHPPVMVRVKGNERDLRTEGLNVYIYNEKGQVFEMPLAAFFGAFKHQDLRNEDRRCYHLETAHEGNGAYRFTNTLPLVGVSKIGIKNTNKADPATFTFEVLTAPKDRLPEHLQQMVFAPYYAKNERPFDMADFTLCTGRVPGIIVMTDLGIDDYGSTGTGRTWSGFVYEGNKIYGVVREENGRIRMIPLGGIAGGEDLGMGWFDAQVRTEEKDAGNVTKFSNIAAFMYTGGPRDEKWRGGEEAVVNGSIVYNRIFNLKNIVMMIPGWSSGAEDMEVEVFVAAYVPRGMGEPFSSRVALKKNPEPYPEFYRDMDTLPELAWNQRMAEVQIQNILERMNAGGEVNNLDRNFLEKARVTFRVLARIQNHSDLIKENGGTTTVYYDLLNHIFLQMFPELGTVEGIHWKEIPDVDNRMIEKKRGEWLGRFYDQLHTDLSQEERGRIVFSEIAQRNLIAKDPQVLVVEIPVHEEEKEVSTPTPQSEPEVNSGPEELRTQLDEQIVTLKQSINWEEMQPERRELIGIQINAAVGYFDKDPSELTHRSVSIFVHLLQHYQLHESGSALMERNRRILDFNTLHPVLNNLVRVEQFRGAHWENGRGALVQDKVENPEWIFNANHPPLERRRLLFNMIDQLESEQIQLSFVDNVGHIVHGFYEQQGRGDLGAAVADHVVRMGQIMLRLKENPQERERWQNMGEEELREMLGLFDNTPFYGLVDYIRNGENVRLSSFEALVLEVHPDTGQELKPETYQQQRARCDEYLK